MWPHAFDSVSTHISPIFSICIVHFWMDCVALAHLIFQGLAQKQVFCPFVLSGYFFPQHLHAVCIVSIECAAARPGLRVYSWQHGAKPVHLENCIESLQLTMVHAMHFCIVTSDPVKVEPPGWGSGYPRFRWSWSRGDRTRRFVGNSRSGMRAPWLALEKTRDSNDSQVLF